MNSITPCKNNIAQYSIVVAPLDVKLTVCNNRKQLQTNNIFTYKTVICHLHKTYIHRV